MIKILFADLDGTLLDLTGRVNATTIQAVKERELPITLVSARAPMEMRSTIDALALTGPQIAFNGGLIYDIQAGTVVPIQQHPLKQARAAALLTFIQQNFPQVSLSCYTQTDWFTEQIYGGIRHEQQLTGQPATVTTYATLLAREQPIYKITVMTLDFDVISALATAIKALGYTDISAKLSGTTYLELTSIKAQKSRGIQFIQDQAQLTKAELAAIGDSENDLPMLAAVGYPIVMGNAMPAIKEKGAVVTKSNAENGVAYALTHFLTKEE